MKKWKVVLEVAKGWAIQTTIEASTPIVAVLVARESLAREFPQWADIADSLPISSLEVA